MTESQPSAGSDPKMIRTTAERDDDEWVWYVGLAERALSVAKAYVSERDAFGSSLADKQAVRFEIAEVEPRLHTARTMVRNAADQLAAGDEARAEVAMCKVFTANVVQDIVDTALQLWGGNGIAKDLPLADFYEHVRPFRIIDEADEVHKRTIAGAAFESVDRAELDSTCQIRRLVIVSTRRTTSTE